MFKPAALCLIAAFALTACGEDDSPNDAFMTQGDAGEDTTTGNDDSTEMDMPGDSSSSSTDTGSDTGSDSSSDSGSDSGTSSDTGGGDCGNGQIDMSEQCDGANLNGFTCEQLGYGGGTLGCDPITCTYDTSNCTAGDGGTSG